MPRLAPNLAQSGALTLAGLENASLETRNHRLAAPYFAVCLEHREAVLLLISQNMRASVFALWRPTYENYMRGHPYLRTPNIDALAARGVRFTNAFVNSGGCGRSRMSFYTGLCPISHGATWNRVPLAVGEVMLGEMLQGAGLKLAQGAGGQGPGLPRRLTTRCGPAKGGVEWPAPWRQARPIEAAWPPFSGA